jgi:hypothetical protein
MDGVRYATIVCYTGPGVGLPSTPSKNEMGIKSPTKQLDLEQLKGRRGKMIGDHFFQPREEGSAHSSPPPAHCSEYEA